MEGKNNLCTVCSFAPAYHAKVYKEMKWSSEFGGEDWAAQIPDLNLIQHLLEGILQAWLP